MHDVLLLAFRVNDVNSQNLREAALQGTFFGNIGCSHTWRVNSVYFLETWLKILNNLTWLKVSYNKIMGLYFMSGHTEMGYEAG